MRVKDKNSKNLSFDGVFNLPKAEEKVLKFWDENHIFEKSMEARKSGGKKFIFYEGPPYANGKPGIHHVLARVYKDIILRYKTMLGYFVPRRAGWDTHGLPVEMAAEKALGIKSKKEIEKYGIKLFNQKAREQVWIYKDEWESMTRRIGYWLDLKNAYVTYDPDYIESVWWVISQIAKRKLIYKGHKVVPWCTRCGTALSSHELALGYRETVDQSVYLKFKLREGQRVSDDLITDENTYILSWTTTPWTLPGNVALAVGEKIEYAVVKKLINKRFEKWIVAKELCEKEGNMFCFPGDANITVFGKNLAGVSYEPLFNIPIFKTENAYKIYSADFVETAAGTGVVHTAVMYGEDDYRLGEKMGLPQRHTVDEEGKFTKDVPGFAGLYVKSKETDALIFEHLKNRGNLLKIEPYSHEYPYCWRCETPILYYARNSWFIKMSELRNKLLASNKKINWIPEHVKEGRFGEWLKEVKDWNISRERYWGTPLPIWECRKCGSVDVLGSLEEFARKTGESKNKYWIMRHGESQTQLLKIIDSGQKKYGLTVIGRDEAARSAEKLRKELGRKKQKIDMIISSDVLRTRETAKIAASILGVKRVVFDKRAEEIHLGELTGCHSQKYRDLFPTYESKFEKRPEGGESLRDLRARVWQLLEETEKKYRGRNILLVSHEYPIWMFYHAASGWSEKRAIEEKKKRGDDFVKVAELNSLELKILPRDETGEIDLHRPYVDSLPIKCRRCGGKVHRIKEVADVWFDSGSMPFASVHYPFTAQINADKNADKRGYISVNQRSDRRKSAAGFEYPADFIAEGMDQTRGWFYTLHAIATALGFEASYKNVISLGLINDKSGQKMSKSKGNIVDPWVVIQKYGADAVRWYFFTVNPPGEPKNFDENDLVKSFRRMHLLLWNSLAFYKTYSAGGKVLALKSKPKNLLDRWILARLDSLIKSVSGDLEKYDVRDAAIAAEVFVDDLSRWYIRRSRRRFSAVVKGYGGKFEHAEATATLGSVLGVLSRLLAPFTPFFAEILHAKLSLTDSESVHLSDWPAPMKNFDDQELLKAMAEVRRLASIALAKRAEAGIKVRQPLGELRIKNKELRGLKNVALLEILAEEINVKKIILDVDLKEEMELDTVVTPELREEGIIRELTRAIQDLRQRAGLKQKDRIALSAQLPAEIRLILQRKESFLLKEIGAETIDYKKSEKFDAEADAKIAEYDVWLGVRKIGD